MEEIEQTFNEHIELQAENQKLKQALLNAKNIGFDDDCIFCAEKDKRITKALEEFNNDNR